MQGDVTTSLPIFGIFQGGGAKGITHVGAYAAATDLGFEFVGVAGASAGSIIAALVAVGFSPREIFDPDDPRRDIFSDHQLTPLGVLGGREWQILKLIRRFWRPVAFGEVALSLLAFGAAILDLARVARWSAGGATLLMLLLFCFGTWFVLRRGIFDPAHFAVVFNSILRRRVLEVYRDAGKDTSGIPQYIRFRDIDPQQSSLFCRLKVVVTDISGEQLRLFDHRTPDVAIAEAVAASIAIPGVFKPAAVPSFDGHYLDGHPPHDYADGGLVSNLPVWCFAEEKAALERRTLFNAPVPVVAFTLADDNIRRSRMSRLSPWQYYARVLYSGIFGSQTTIQEFVEDLYVIRLESALSVLAFDTDRLQAAAAFNSGRDQARAALDRRLRIEPTLWHEELGNVCETVRSILLGTAADRQDFLLRAGLFEPIRSAMRTAYVTPPTAYRVRHSFNMERDADDRLTLDAACPGVPEAFEERTIVLLKPESTSSRQLSMSKYERALVRRSMKSAICVPIFADSAEWRADSIDRERPVAVISFDSDEDIATALQGDDSMLRSITEATLGLASLFTEDAKDWQ
jgi:NTE family protein